MPARRGWLNTILRTAAVLGLAASLTPWLPALAATALAPKPTAKRPMKVTTSAQKATSRTLAASLRTVSLKGGATKVDVLVAVAKGSPRPAELEFAVRVRLKALSTSDVYAGRVRASRLTKLATGKGVRLVTDNGNRTPPRTPDVPRPTAAAVKSAAATKAIRLAEATRSGAVRKWAAGFRRDGTRRVDDAVPKTSAAADPLAALADFAGIGTGASAGAKFGSGWFDVLSNHRSSYAWAKGHTGAGVRVAVIDEGVDFAHPDLQGTEATVPAGSPYAGWPMAFDPFSCFLLATDQYYGTEYVSSGQSWFSATTATVPSGDAVVFGGAMFKTAGLVAASKSGTYHIGYLNDANVSAFSQNPEYQKPAVLVADPNTAGVYDTVYVDLNFDRDFADDKVCTRGGGIAPVSYLDFWDSRHQFPGPDGYADISGGMVYWIADGATAPPGYTPAFGSMPATPGAGTMVAFMGALDEMADHGTLCGSNVAAQGRIDGVSAFEANPAAFPSFKGSSTGGIVQGAGRDVGLVAIGDMYNNFTASALLSWDFSGYGPDGVARSGDEVQVTSNSFGESGTFSTEWDFMSRYVTALNLGEATSTVFLFSTGNGAPGYGTGTPPKATTGIAVGASTQYGSTGYPFDSAVTTDQITYGDIAPFSNRGPTAMGHLGVDVVADGSVASGDEPLNMVGDGWTAWASWAGTSRSTPVAAGNVALAYQAYRDRTGTWPTYDQARQFLMNGAVDSNYDTFTQGSGRVDGERSADLAAGAGGLSVSPPALTPGSWRGDHYPGYASVLATGASETSSLTISNVGPAPKTVTVTPAGYVRAKTQTFTVMLDPGQESPYRAERPDYLRNVTADIPADADLVVFRVRTPIVEIDPSGSLGAASSTNGIRSLAYDWTDQGGKDGRLWTDANGNGFVNDGEIQFGEYVRFAYANNDGPTSEVRVQRPLSRMHSGVFFGLQQSRRRGNPLHVTVEMSCWKRAPWDKLHVVGPATFSLASRATTSVAVRITAPDKLGLYDGQFRVSDGATVTVVPVTINVAGKGASITLGGNDATSALMPNGAVLGMQDWSWRAESGDWRTFMTDIADSTSLPAGAQWVVRTRWATTPTDIDTLLFGPAPSYGADFPAYNAFVGPGEMVPTGGSASTYLGAGLWAFYTATGGPEEWAAAPLSKGLNEIRLHNIVSDGASTATTFTGETGVVSVAPQAVVETTKTSAGSFKVDLGTSMRLAAFNGRAWGLTPVWDRLRSVTQDAAFVREFSVTGGAYIDVRTMCKTSDIDLTLEYYDPGADSWYAIGTSQGSSGDEQLRVVTPYDGTYRAVVFGYSVTGGQDSFRLRIATPQGSDGLSVTGLTPGDLATGATATARASWHLTRDSVDSRDAAWEGVAGFGPGVVNQLLSVPVDIAYPFEIYSSSPSPNGTWPANQPITIDLSRRADPSTVTTKTVFLQKSDRSVVAASVSYDDDLARISLSAPTLARETTYTLTITASVHAVDGTLLKPAVFAVHTGPQRVTRAYGQTRYDTAVAASQASFAKSASVVVASGQDFPDALAASGLCGALKAPLLLTPYASLPTVVSDEIARLGATKAYVIGGPTVVSGDVFEQLVAKLGAGATDSPNVVRLSGNDRYATAGQVAGKIADLAGDSAVPEVLIVRADRFQDALSAAAPAYSRGAPVLFVAGGSKVLPRATVDAFDEIGAGTAYVVGGPTVVTTAAVSLVNTHVSRPAVRWSGADAYGTSAAVAEQAALLGWLRWSYVGLATGTNFPDGLSGGVSAAARGGPLMLTPPSGLPTPVSAAIRTYRAVIDQVAIYGGPGAVSSKVDTDVAATLK